MRVKNDAINILNILIKLLEYATDYIINDYNSIDDTVNICNKFFKNNNVKGQIFNSVFFNNLYLDQPLLELGRKYSDSDYLWLYDTCNKIEGKLILPKLSNLSYMIKFKYIRDPKISKYSFEKSITQIFSNNIEWKEKSMGYITTVDETIDNKSILIEGEYYLSTGILY